MAAPLESSRYRCIWSDDVSKRLCELPPTQTAPIYPLFIHPRLRQSSQDQTSTDWDQRWSGLLLLEQLEDDGGEEDPEYPPSNLDL